MAIALVLTSPTSPVSSLPLDLCKFLFTFPFPNELIVPLLIFLFVITIARYVFTIARYLFD
jgi:hypothetical protein